MSSNFRYTMVRTVRPYVKYFPQLTKPVLRVLIKVSVHYLESSKCSPEELDLELTKLTHSGQDIPDNFCELFAAVLQIMQIFLRTPKGIVKDHELRDCLKELRFTDECVEDLSKVLYNHRASLTKNFIEAKTTRSKPKNLQWRINISLGEGYVCFNSLNILIFLFHFFRDSTCNGSINAPTIILHFQLPDGRYRTLEFPLSMFHQLRYNVALLLSEMQALESRAVMKKF
ncbi:PREDICTED: COMM domain-containing protein 5 isoform X1 [Bactrocera latifrons]|uniref:COMM domain-containing protein 5 isoform X1 n=1 Tax=Bactrocera latifrons TaxID=174628 RepID=UPI0008DCD70E|nr:PREDICTED: COMM domain-containing protein 5 isoform X1 [Bactrocera latifrons]